MRAISTFSLEAGTSTFWCRACSALRTLVSISATGSVNLIVCFSSRHPFAPHSAENLQRLPYHLLQPCNPERDSLCLPLLSRARRLLSREGSPAPQTRKLYHEDFDTPGISPSSASCRKHIRH